MPEVDYEAAWLSLKAYVVGKRSHGARDLALRMAEIEVEHEVPAGQEGFDPSPHKPSTERPALSVAGHG